MSKTFEKKNNLELKGDEVSKCFNFLRKRCNKIFWNYVTLNLICDRLSVGIDILKTRRGLLNQFYDILTESRCLFQV